MTTIAAVQGPSWVVVAYDSSVSEDNRKYVLPRTSGKMWDNGAYFLGAAGDYRAVNILAHSFVPPDPSKNRGIKLDKFMVQKFVPAMKVCFDNNFYGKDNEHPSVVMVVVNGTAYVIGENYDCARDESGLYAIGSGSQFAIGALTALDAETGRSIRAARSNLDVAMSIAATYDSGTGPPTHITVKHWRSR